MILDITSFGWSGSGAYHDLLREYDKTEYPYEGDWEFSLLWMVDGIYDLEDKLCHKCCRVYDSDIAIQRFLSIAKILDKSSMIGYNKVFKAPTFYELCSDYINKLIGIKFPGHCFNDITHPNKWEKYSAIYNKYNLAVQLFLCNRYTRKLGINKYTNKLFFHNPHEMKVAYFPKDFLEITQDFIDQLFDYMRTDKSNVLVMDQMFPPDCPDLFYKYVREETKSIIVRRDPRDTYIAMNEASYYPYPIPKTINEFIWFYKNIVEGSRVPDNDNRISINFEDLIYKYDETVNKLNAFIDLGNHTHPKKWFDPNVSINNTQLITLYPKYANDVKRIEEELPGSLYPFEKFDFKRTSTRIF